MQRAASFRPTTFPTQQVSQHSSKGLLLPSPVFILVRHGRIGGIRVDEQHQHAHYNAVPAPETEIEPTPARYSFELGFLCVKKFLILQNIKP